MKNVVAYIRVSTDGQLGDDKFGLEAQREQIIDYCRRNDMNILNGIPMRAKAEQNIVRGLTRSFTEMSAILRMRLWSLQSRTEWHET